MPLDPRIALGVQPVAMPNPLDALQTITQLQNVREQTETRRLAAEKARQAAADDAAMRQALTATGGDVDAALPQLRQINPRAAATFEEQVGKARKEHFDALKNEADYKGKQLDLGLKIASSVTDAASARAARPAILGMAPTLAPLLPPDGDTFDQAGWQRIVDMGLSAKDRHDQQRTALDDWAKGDVRKALSTMYSTVDPASPDAPQRWTQIGTLARSMGAKPEDVALFGDFSPANVARAAQLGVSSEKRAELAGQAETRAQTAAHQTVEEANAAANLRIAGAHLAVSQAAERRQAANPELVQVLQDGKAVWVPKSQAVGQAAAGGAAGRPATGAEHQALAYYTRAKEAVDTLTTPDAQTGKSLEDSVSGSATRLGDVPVIGNYLLTPDAQRYVQAQRAFTEARLRKESGGTIRADEYENDKKTYFKQPGDSAAVIEQKRKAREAVLNGLAGSAGRAYEDYYGEPFTRSTGSRAPGAGAVPANVTAALQTVGAGRHTLSDGTIWEKRADGSIVKAQ